MGNVYKNKKLKIRNFETGENLRREKE